MKSKRPTPTVVIDTREQCPLEFHNLPTEPGTLAAGDYSAKGLEHLIAVERKSLPDLLSCVGVERDRFRRELQRLRGYRFRLLVVECTAGELAAGDWRSKVHTNAVLGSLAAWQAQFSLPIWLGETHGLCGEFVERFLYQASRCIVEDFAAALAFVDPPWKSADAANVPESPVEAIA